MSVWLFRSACSASKKYFCASSSSSSLNKISVWRSACCFKPRAVLRYSSGNVIGGPHYRSPKNSNKRSSGEVGGDQVTGASIFGTVGTTDPITPAWRNGGTVALDTAILLNPPHPNNSDRCLRFRGYLKRISAVGHFPEI